MYYGRDTFGKSIAAAFSPLPFNPYFKIAIIPLSAVTQVPSGGKY
jgi:hypothetical protein